jgi:hypothetical protein
MAGMSKAPEVIDDGRGIDPAAILQKAYEGGLIDEDTLCSMADEMPLNWCSDRDFPLPQRCPRSLGAGSGWTR